MPKSSKEQAQIVSDFREKLEIWGDIHAIVEGNPPLEKFLQLAREEGIKKEIVLEILLETLLLNK